MVGGRTVWYRGKERGKEEGGRVCIEGCPKM